VADGTTTMTTAGTGTVLVRYFAAAAEAAGVEEERLELAGAETAGAETAGTETSDGPTLGELRDELVARYGAAMARVVANGSFLVDGVVRRDPATPIGAQVDVLPPFAGG
jgi:molybdopterin synthase sulfur carrier subunit